MTFALRTALLAVLFAPVAAPVALAQQTFAPAASSAPVAAEGAGLAYRSAFEGYRGFTDQPVGSWRRANDDAGRSGGGHGPAMPAGHGGMRMGPAASAPVAPPKAPAGHSGHRMP